MGKTSKRGKKKEGKLKGTGDGGYLLYVKIQATVAERKQNLKLCLRTVDWIVTVAFVKKCAPSYIYAHYAVNRKSMLANNDRGNL